MENKAFISTIWTFYQASKRDLAWRKTQNPYFILVSEIMLQQTQVERVKTFYTRFIITFPTIQDLAEAPLTKVLLLWKGLGYNRRAVNLKKTAEIILLEFKGKFPRTYEELITLPGIGPGTAGAILNFAYSVPTAFIETNIRTVYLHFFFKKKHDIRDADILKLISKHLMSKMPFDSSRDWFYALYDYGSMLKKTIGNQNKRSIHYKKQSIFKGSNRELRSLMLQYLLTHPKSTVAMVTIVMKKKTGKNKETILNNLKVFEKEGLILPIERYVTISS